MSIVIHSNRDKLPIYHKCYDKYEGNDIYGEIIKFYNNNLGYGDWCLLVDKFDKTNSNDMKRYNNDLAQIKAGILEDESIYEENHLYYINRDKSKDFKAFINLS